MRALSSEMQNALASTNVRVALLFEMEAASAVNYFASTPHDLSWGGHTWLGNGWLKPFNDISEVADIGASGLKLRIGGVDPLAVSLILNSLALRNHGTLYLGFLDSNLALIPDPFMLYRGLYDQSELRDDGVSSEILLSYENSRIRQQKAKELRYTDQCQQSLFPGDTGFRYAAQVADWSGFWGKAGKVKIIHRRKSGGGKSS